MTDYTRNPFFNSPYLEQTGNNLIKAFNDDGKAEENRARVGLLNAQTAKQTRENQGVLDTAGAIQGQDFSTGKIAPQFFSQLGAAAVRGGMSMKDLSQGLQMLTANSGAPDSAIAASVVGNKGGLGVNEGVSLGDRNAIAQKSEDAAMGRTKYSADSSAGASRANNADTLAFHERHAFDNPVQVAPEHAVYPNANDPRMKGVVPGSMPVPRMVTAFDTNSPSGASRQEDKPGVPTPIKPEHMITAFDATSPSGGVRAIDKPGVIPAAKEEKPLTLTPQAAADMKFNVFQSIPGAMAADGKSVDPTFQQQFGDKIQAAETAAAETYKKTKDATAAEKAFKDTLGIKPNQTFSPGTWPFTSPGLRGGTPTPEAAVPLDNVTAKAPPKIADHFGAPPLSQDGNIKPNTALDEARNAIAKGVPREKVIQRLKQNGIDPAALEQQNANDGAR